MHQAGDRQLGVLAFAFADRSAPYFFLTALTASRRSSLSAIWKAWRRSLGQAEHLLFQRLVVRPRAVARLLGGLFRQADDGVDGGLHLLVAEHHRAQHDVFAEFLGFGFHHHHGVMRAGDDQVELDFRHVVDRRIEHIFAVDEADARGADRAHEGQAGNGQRGGGRDHRHDIGIVLQVVGQHGRHHQRLVA